MKELIETAAMMGSADYKERFRAEYYQLETRLAKLHAMVKKWDNGELNFTPDCPRSLYELQVRSMAEYKAVLEARAKIEGIDLHETKSGLGAPAVSEAATRNTVTQEEVKENMRDLTIRTLYDFGKPTTYVTIRMKNGFTLRESTTCVDPRNYNEEIGVEICLKRLEQQVWFLLGYALQDKLYNNGAGTAMPPSC